jgi:hypothetical protein
MGTASDPLPRFPFTRYAFFVSNMIAMTFQSFFLPNSPIDRPLAKIRAPLPL